MKQSTRKRAGVIVSVVLAAAIVFSGVGQAAPNTEATSARVIPPTDVLAAQSTGVPAAPLAPNVITKITLWMGTFVDISTPAAWDSANNRFEIPPGGTGTYQLTSSVDWERPCANATGLIQVRVNNATIHNIGQEELSGDAAGNRPIFGATMVVKFNAGDQIDLRLRHTCSTAMGATVRSFAIDRIA